MSIKKIYIYIKNTSKSENKLTLSVSMLSSSDCLQRDSMTINAQLKRCSDLHYKNGEGRNKISSLPCSEMNFTTCAPTKMVMVPLSVYIQNIHYEVK